LPDLADAGCEPGLSFGFRLGAGSLGQVDQTVSGQTVRALQNYVGFLPFQMSRRDAQKE
jgi:hypothetical protein